MTTTLANPQTAPPDKWVDHIAVERILLGREPVGRPLSAAERAAAFPQLVDAGHTSTEICARLGISGSVYARMKRAYNAERDGETEQ
ncbi:hypothetical protein SAMN05421805_12774 [Saccharopolyspora antimicrobica]|uniref:Homeodomain-like domain-containing protein n=1 Tax=Saccharopolyspora antimicrobica TaxID=455193 RepID=A0A1I5KLU0_9PSEU|nr:helix-turn-helix domain-containing protein [Saccharopolyspora antimicrobica]RKT85623.1 hypothetical protein ATL45_3970 [Saccharopolyspora antimicrobica]SFO85965.1 hypothetical protein SAMN05421805_12774 [Saccharopolyspora antimicrobica]